MTSPSKILSVQTLARVLAREHRRGRRVVFTNGVYDLIHAGHVTLLMKAKRLGDILVVGLNSDASVRRLKGPKRPMASQMDRGLVVGALACVDFVTFFSEDTPYNLIARLKPDILVKGGDYKLSEIVGRDDVKKVIRFPVVRGNSTSALIQKIVNRYKND